MVVLAAAALITAATSYVDAGVAETVDGGSFLLTPDEPLVTVPVTFAATQNSFEGDPEVSLYLSYSLTWSEVEVTTNEGIGVRLVPVDAAGRTSPMHDPHCRLGDCATSCFGRQCLGDHELVFRWPEQLEGGSVRVEWSLEGWLTWPDDGGFFSRAPEVPEGAELRLEAGERTGGTAAPTPVADWQTVVDRDVAVVRESVTVTTSGPLDGGVLALESRFDPRFDPGQLRVALPGGWTAGDPPIHLASASSVPIAVPDDCRGSACTFTFDTLVQLVRPRATTYRSASIGWVITATTPVDVAVSSSTASIPEVGAQASLGRIVLGGAEATDALRFVVELPAASLPSGEWPPGHADDAHADDAEVDDTPNHLEHQDAAVGAGPVVLLELRPDVGPGTLDLERYPPVRLEVVSGRETEPPAARRLAWWEEEAATPPSQWGPWRTVLPNECRPDEACEIEVEVLAAFSNGAESADHPGIAFDVEAEVTVFLPWTQPTPSERPTIGVVTGDR